MNKLYAILVIYNKSVIDSCTYMFCKEHKDINLIICDNSTEENDNSALVENDGYVYMDMQGNKGLSKAYNKALDFLMNKDGYVILLDDDTILNEDYLKCVKDLNCDIAIPIVKDEVSILSPSNIKKGVVSRWDGKSVLESFTAINSGMVISLNVFKNYRYDENLFLDYVDHQFLKDMYDKNIKILNCTIQQKFSGNETADLNASYQRFKIFKKDSKYFYRKNRKIYFYVVYKREFRLILQYKSLKFLRS